MGARAACTVRWTRKERESTGAEGCGNEVKSERTLAVECMTVALSRTGKASPFHLATQVFISSLVQRSWGGMRLWISPLAHRWDLLCGLYVAQRTAVATKGWQ